MSVVITDTDKGWAQIKRDLLGVDELEVAVGFVAGKGAERGHGSLSTVELAAIHEYGAPAAHIPERSFLRSTYDRVQGEIEKLIDRLAGQVISGAMDVRKALGIVGARFSADVKNTVTQIGVPPPLSPKTIARKGSSRALVDTGKLIGAVTWAVRKRGGEGG